MTRISSSAVFTTLIALTEKRLRGLCVLLALWAVTSPSPVTAQTNRVLPSPLSLGEVIRLASERRDEIQAARARIRAGEQRPVIASALADPMIAPSLDHLLWLLKSPFLLRALMLRPDRRYASWR